MSRSRNRPISKEMAKYFLELEKLRNNLVGNRVSTAFLIASRINVDFDQNTQYAFSQQMADYAYGED